MSILRFRKDSQKTFHEKATQLDFESIHEDGGKKRNKSYIKRRTLVLALVFISMCMLIVLVAYKRQSIQLQTSSTETKDDIIYLNETTSLSPYYGNLKNHPSTGPKIDILVIGTRNNPSKLQTQKETWASHPSRRHFFLATEYDDHDPMCDQHHTLEDIKKDLRTCKRRGLEISSDAPQTIQKKFKTYYSREDWLLKRKNPAGWYCAQKRHSVGLAKVVALYQGLMNQPNQLPDYLFVGDDDSYVNLDHISEMLLLQPQRLEASTGISQEHSPVPTHETPVVWTGCRVRWPVHEVNFTFGYGGFGHFFSKASLLRMLQPLYCNSTSTAQHSPDSGIPMEMASYEKHACERLKSENALIGEDKHFVPGMNLMDIWFNMTKLDPFCMHADWIYGYFVNYYRISRRTVHSNGLNWFEDREGDFPDDRLHALTANSEIYRKGDGLCKYDDNCEKNATVCHHIDEVNMTNIHASYSSMKNEKKGRK